MKKTSGAISDWRKLTVAPDKVLERIEPGMSIFISTGPAEPRTLVRALAASERGQIQDLDIIQLVSFGDALAAPRTGVPRFRLKTFFSGWIANEAIQEGRVDLIPSRFSAIPEMIESGALRVDVVFVQITPPDSNGYCRFGLAVDVARTAMDAAQFVVGEINERVPRTQGDTLVRLDEFDLLVASDEEPIPTQRWPVDEAFDRVAANVAGLVEDGACVAYSIGPLFDALAPHLTSKRDLGIHSPIITDAAMDLIKSGAVTNRRKTVFRGKTLASWALGTPELHAWLDDNPLVEFQGTDVTCSPEAIARNDRFRAIVHARKVDITGAVALPFGKGKVAVGPGEAHDLISGAKLSKHGRTIIALPSRNRKGEPNILLSVDGLPNQILSREFLDLIVTDYGVAQLVGRTVRERAQAIIDIAHPDDRAELVRHAKEANILYRDQIFLADAGHFYPDVATTRTFKGGLAVGFRAIRPSDEEEMRRLFYRFSDQAVYYRYFSPIKSMPHTKMQAYVNVDYRRVMSIVGVVGEPGGERIIAEGRWALPKNGELADVAFVVDEQYQARGIATFLFSYLVGLARERGVPGFTADVLATNTPMMRAFEKSPFVVKAVLSGGVYELTIPFSEPAAAGRSPINFQRREQE